MPSFTLELWRAISLKPEGMSDAEWLGMDSYPIFDEAYRPGLNSKIIDHFMYQEIGHETLAQFQFAMKRKLNEIMPRYNELYKTTRMEFDPLLTMDIKTVTSGMQTQTSEGDSEQSTDSNVGSVGKNVSSVFPQTMLAGSSDYATSGADTNSQTATTGTASETSRADSTAASDGESHTVGYQGSPVQMIQAYRAAIINVDLLVIAELDELFMMIWNSGDSFTTGYERFV